MPARSPSTHSGLPLLALLAFAATVPAGIAADAPATAPAGASTQATLATFPVEDLRPGMRGILRTVLQGSEPVTLELEILGVLDDGIGPGVPLILARFTDETGRWTGVAAGMSGSPVLIDGKLLGALSYSIGAFSKEPICGITPIDTMLALERYPGGLAPASGSAALSTSPVPLALAASGLNAPALEALRDQLAAIGIPAAIATTPLAVASTSAASDPARLAPGDPVAALLVWGDLVLGATGTITWREGDELLAFGHPFLGFGRLDLPMAPAEVIWTVPSELSSFKIARIGQPMGSVDQDRLTAIRGRLGRESRGVAMTVGIAREGRPDLDKKFFLAKDPLITPILAGITLQSLLAQELGSERDEALTMSARVTLASGRSLRIESAGPNPGAAAARFSGELAQLVGNLTQAPLALPELESIDIAIGSVEPFGGLSIVRALPDRLAARPGETIRVTVDLEGPRGLARREAIDVVVPPQTRRGRYTLMVGSARSLDVAFGVEREALRRTATTAETYLDSLEREYSDAVLEARLALPAEGMVTAGGSYPALPGSAHILLRSRPGGTPMYRTRWVAAASARIALDRAVAEVARISIAIDAGTETGSGEEPSL